MCLTGLAVWNVYCVMLPMFLIGSKKKKKKDVLKALKVCLVDTFLKVKTGYLQNVLKNLLGNLIKS